MSRRVAAAGAVTALALIVSLSLAGAGLTPAAQRVRPVPCPRAAQGSARASGMSDPIIQDMVDSVSTARLEHHICKLQDDDRRSYCNASGTRYWATAGLNEAKQYLLDQFSAMGLAVRYDTVYYWGANVVAELPGKGPDRDRIYIVSAHYDSIAGNQKGPCWGQDPWQMAPGADDNASGSAAVLEAAQILSQYRFSHTLRFIHFTGEEVGGLGSRQYAQEARERGELIDGVINLDMIGYESVPPGDHIVQVYAGTDPASVALGKAMLEAIAVYGIALSPELVEEGAITDSDHASFWEEGYAAILGSEDSHDTTPHYHCQADSLETLQMDLVTLFTQATVATIAELAGLLPGTPTLTPWASATPTVTVPGSATPTPTLSDSPTPTWTLSASPTLTTTPTRTVAPTTPTGAPKPPVCLPLILRDSSRVLSSPRQ